MVRSEPLYRFFTTVKFHFEDMWSKEETTDINFYLETYAIISETPKTYLINYQGQDKRVLKGNGKRLAYETKKWAWESLKHRTKWRLYHTANAHKKAKALYDYLNQNPEMIQEPDRIFTMQGSL